VNSPLNKLFGERIRTLRQAAGLSQEAFADRCGFARSYMSRIERGRGNPSLTAVEVLCAALKVEAYELFVPLQEPVARKANAPLVPFAADGSYFHPGLTKPRSNRYYVGTKGAVKTFDDFDTALAWLVKMKEASWFRPNASGNWSPVKAVRWDELPE
jgi:transcriptional regulator with XRE-family HTH domain